MERGIRRTQLRKDTMFPNHMSYPPPRPPLRIPSAVREESYLSASKMIVCSTWQNVSGMLKLQDEGPKFLFHFDVFHSFFH